MNEQTLAAPETKEVQKAINGACRILAIREHSQKQLSEKLRKKGFADYAINKAIDYLITENWLSEERFCSSYIRSKAAKGQGELRIEMALHQHGLSADLINRSFEEQNIDWSSLCLEVAMKKIRTMGHIAPNQNPVNSEGFEIGDYSDYEKQMQQKLKLERFLRYRGFALDDIKKTITKCIKSRSAT